MKSVDPLLAAWEKILALNGDRPAIYDTKRRVLLTFREIEERARQIESTTTSPAGNVSVVDIGNRPGWPSIVLACLRKRIVVVPVDQSISQQEKNSIIATCLNTVQPDRTGSNNSEVTIAWKGEQPTLLKFTSGTTGEPRAIRFRSAQLVADCEQICDTMGITERDLNFGVIPISHSYGFSNLLMPLLVRGVPMVLSEDRLPRAVLDDLAGTKATVFPGMPLFYQAFCEMNDLPPLPNLRLCISAGAPLSAAVAKKFAERFEQPIHSFYGSSECGGICYDRAGNTFQDGFVGKPMEGVAVEIIEPTANASQVRVRSAAVGDSYFPEPNEHKLGNGIFIPDDLLARDDNGFKIVGRISDVINVAGKKVNPAEVEATLLALPGIRQAIVFGRKSALRNEEVAACVVANADVSEAEIMQSCRTRLSGWQVPKRVFIVDEMPANERGKTSRRDLAKRFADR